MKNRITSVAPWQAGKTLALVYFAIGLLIAIPMSVLTRFTPPVPGQTKPGVLFFIAMPFLYGVLALVFVPLGCWIYNTAARITGGIEMRLESSDDA